MMTTCKTCAGNNRHHPTARRGARGEVQGATWCRGNRPGEAQGAVRAALPSPIQGRHLHKRAGGCYGTARRGAHEVHGT